MTKTQTPEGRPRKIAGWSGRHKVAAGFMGVAIAVLLYIGGSWAALQVQTHFERERFMAANRQLSELGRQVVAFGDPKISMKRDCSYTGDTGFGVKWLGCEVELDVSYLSVTRVQASVYSQKIVSTMLGDGLKLHPAEVSDYFNEISSYSFMYRRLNCTFSTQFFDSTNSLSNRYGSAANQGNSANISINCGSNAKTKYFPLVGN